jgi:hypothetical protein
MSADISSVQWQLLVLIVFSSGAGAIFLFYFGLRRVSASTTTILELFWPFSALILDYVFNNNYLNTIEIIAATVLMISFFKVSTLDNIKVRFKAKVIKGEGRGKKLGYPTANLDKTDLDNIYYDCGQFYFTNTKNFLINKKLFTNNTQPIIISESECQDIDNEEDWKIAELKYKLKYKIN